MGSRECSLDPLEEISMLGALGEKKRRTQAKGADWKAKKAEPGLRRERRETERVPRPPNFLFVTPVRSCFISITSGHPIYVYGYIVSEREALAEVKESRDNRDEAHDVCGA